MRYHHSDIRKARRIGLFQVSAEAFHHCVYSTTLTRRLVPCSAIAHKLSNGSQLAACIRFDELGVDVEGQSRTAPLDNGLVPGDKLLALRLGKDHAPHEIDEQDNVVIS